MQECLKCKSIAYKHSTTLLKMRITVAVNFISTLFRYVMNTYYYYYVLTMCTISLYTHSHIHFSTPITNQCAIGLKIKRKAKVNEMKCTQKRITLNYVTNIIQLSSHHIASSSFVVLLIMGIPN